MRNNLAEHLLGEVLKWSGEDLKEERPILASLAHLKYDEYHQYAPGMKFIESLACWLNQFSEIEERQEIYRFLKKKLIFFSEAEMKHLVDVTYPTIIRPIFTRIASVEMGIPPWKVTQLAKKNEYKELKTRSLFLGLSDGARIDRFRRVNNSELSNEQILPYYDLSDEKVEAIKKYLTETLAKIRNKDPSKIPCEDAKIKLLFLIDDFSASGLSMIRQKNNKFKGKLAKINDFIQKRLTDLNFVNKRDIKVHIILYVLAEQAQRHLDIMLPQLCGDTYSNWQVSAILKLRKDCVFKGDDEDNDIIKQMINNYYDKDIMDDDLRVGGTEDVRLGFAGCGLPLVLSHNTPNDSLFLLWSYSEKVKGLFPRIPRHRG